MSNSFYTSDELNQLGLKSYGDNVLISRKCSIYSPEKIILGNNVRIDDFCILSGSIVLGSFIHISAFCALYGQYGIELQDYSGLSPKTIVFSATDDFSGDYLIGPMCPKNTTNVKGGKVIIEKYVQIGSGSVIMPSLIIGEGSVIGAMSFVNNNIKPWTINYGIPCKEIKTRSKSLLNLI